MFKKNNQVKLNSSIKKSKNYVKLPKHSKKSIPKATKVKLNDYNFGSSYLNIFDAKVKPLGSEWY